MAILSSSLAGLVLFLSRCEELVLVQPVVAVHQNHHANAKNHSTDPAPPLPGRLSTTRILKKEATKLAAVPGFASRYIGNLPRKGSHHRPPKLVLLLPSCRGMALRSFDGRPGLGASRKGVLAIYRTPAQASAAEAADVI